LNLQVTKNAKERSFALRGSRKAKTEPLILLSLTFFISVQMSFQKVINKSSFQGLLAKPFALLLNPAGQNILFLAPFAPWRFPFFRTM
jgi:hypothetical protein